MSGNACHVWYIIETNYSSEHLSKHADRRAKEYTPPARRKVLEGSDQ